MAQEQRSAVDFTEVTRIQDRAVAEIRDAIRPGGAVLTEAPTGAGKTRINSIVIDQFADDFMATHGHMPVVLALQHREKLLEQSLEALLIWAPQTGLTASRSVAGDMDQSGDVTYAMVQTVAANLALLRTPDLVTVDEAHHASDSKTADYTKVLDRVRALNPDAVLVVTTATPSRPDKRGLNPMLANAERVTIGYSELERAGQIKLPRTKTVNIRTAEGGTTNSIMRSRFKPDKDADPAGLTKALRLARPADYHEQMADAWERDFRSRMETAGVHAGTLAFDPTMKSAQAFADEIASRGYKVAVIDTDHKETNDAALAAYRAGELDMIVSVKMIDEGIDVPRTRCIVVNRETTSEVEYHQMVGRAMRMGSDPVLQAIDPVVLDGGASTMIHGAVERRAAIVDYFQKLARGEIVPERNEDAKWMPQFGGDRYSPWRVLKDPPPVMAVTDGKTSIYAVASRAPDGRAVYSLAETKTVNGRSQVTLMKGADGKPLVGIDEARLHEIEAERLLPSRHSLLRLEATESTRHAGKTLVDDRLLEHPEFIRSAEMFAAAMSRGAGR